MLKISESPEHSSSACHSNLQITTPNSRKKSVSCVLNFDDENLTGILLLNTYFLIYILYTYIKESILRDLRGSKNNLYNFHVGTK